MATVATESSVEGFYQAFTVESSPQLRCAAMPAFEVGTVVTESSLEAQTSTIESSAHLPCSAMPAAYVSTLASESSHVESQPSTVESSAHLPRAAMPAFEVGTVPTESTLLEAQTSTTELSAQLPCTAMPASDVSTLATEFSDVEAQTSTVESSVQVSRSTMPASTVDTMVTESSHVKSQPSTVELSAQLPCAAMSASDVDRVTADTATVELPYTLSVCFPGAATTEASAIEAHAEFRSAVSASADSVATIEASVIEVPSNVSVSTMDAVTEAFSIELPLIMSVSASGSSVSYSPSTVETAAPWSGIAGIECDENVGESHLSDGFQTGVSDSLSQCLAGEDLNCDNVQENVPPVCEPYKKPKRPCPYCGVTQLHLKRHIIRKHGNESSVVESMRLSVTEQKKIFQKLRRQGIYERNRQIIMQNPQSTKEFLSEKRRRMSVDNPRLAMCGNCRGFFAAAHLWRHKRNCEQDGESVDSDLPAHLLMNKAVSADKSSFVTNVLAHFRSDECGSLCIKDKLITNVGEYHYNKCTTKRAPAMSTMRRLGNLLLKFREASSDNELTGEDMLRRNHFPQLRTAIDSLCSDSNDSLKVAIGYLLKTACEVMKGVYLIESNDLLAKEVDDFKVVLDLFWGQIFASAAEKVELRRQGRLRKPARLPAEDDVIRVREHIYAQVNALLSNEYCLWSSQEYTRLRALIVCRLTLFNARRGGEPARLTLREWNDAEQDVWIDKQLVQNVEDPLEKALLGRFKLAYMSGKGTKYLVPVLIPIDLVPAIRKLVAIRDIIGVAPDNPYVFANLQNSLDCVSGWHCVRDICLAAGVENHSRLTATTMRHRASTLYALEDVPEHDRDSFYRHMGHGKDVNKLVYQAPLGVQEVCKMGKYFQKLDSHSAAQSQRNTNVPGANIEAYRVALPSVVPVCAPATADNIPPAAISMSTVDAMANEFSLEAQISTVESSAQLPCTAMPDYDSANNTDSDYLPGY